MQKLIFVLALFVAACQSSVNQPPGRYRDFADYMLDVDPEIISDSRTRGATREQAHCVAERVGKSVHGELYYQHLSAAVSGTALMSTEDQDRVKKQQEDFMNRVRANRNVGADLINGAWDACT